MGIKGDLLFMNQRKIGKVVLDYTYFNTSDVYSDGDIEEVLLDAAKNDAMQKLLYTNNDWAVLYHCSNIRENLLHWYPFKQDGNLLEIGSGCGALTNLFSKKVKSVTCIELSERRSLVNAYRNKNCDNIKIMLGNFQDIKLEEKFDYITLIGVWEYAESYIDSQTPYMDMLRMLKNYLKEDGTILIAIENKMGIKYWNGAVEDHTSRQYSGLNDYVDDKRKIRTFSRPEIEQLFAGVGIDSYKFYYPMPDYKLPDIIYSDDRLPNPGELRQYRQDYNAPRVYNFYDATIQDQLCSDKMIGYFSNSFLIECGKNLSNIIFAKYNRNRKEEYTISTIILNENEKWSVRKSAIFPSAQSHIDSLIKKDKYNFSKMKTLKGKLDGDCYITDYLEGQDVDVFLYQYRNHSTLFINRVGEILETYFRPAKEEQYPFEVTEEYLKLFGENVPENSYSLKQTNVDMIFSNIRIVEDEGVYCLDNEWVYDFPIPYEYVIWRVLSQLYSKYMVYLRNKISKREFMVALGLNDKNFEVYQRMEKNFSKNVLGEDYRKHYLQSALTYGIRFM